jgi:hypothetical protein
MSSEVLLSLPSQQTRYRLEFGFTIYFYTAPEGSELGIPDYDRETHSVTCWFARERERDIHAARKLAQLREEGASPVGMDKEKRWRNVETGEGMEG